MHLVEEAGSFSGHCSLLNTQRTKGYSKFFAKGWRNSLDALTDIALAAYSCAWKRWHIHTTNCKTYWESESLQEALFSPSVSQLFQYLGERSSSGPTAAAGAHTALAGLAKAPKLAFPMEDSALRDLLSNSALQTTHSSDTSPGICAGTISVRTGKHNQRVCGYDLRKPLAEHGGHDP